MIPATRTETSAATHPPPIATSADARQMLAIPESAARRRTFDLATLWLDLTRGNCKIVATFLTQERCYATINMSGPVPRSEPAPSAKTAMLERVLLGAAQKTIAADLDLSRSAIALGCAECLAALGVGGTVSRTPLILVLAAHAAREAAAFDNGRSSVVVEESGCYRVVSAPRPDVLLAEILAPAQCHVARLLIEGKTHAEIARLRSISRRTVANHLTAVFRRFGVSGRLQLVDHLIRETERCN